MFSVSCGFGTWAFDWTPFRSKYLVKPKFIVKTPIKKDVVTINAIKAQSVGISFVKVFLRFF